MTQGGCAMKRIKLALTVAVVMAAMMVFAAPAMADVEQEAESGDVDQSFKVSNDGNNSNQSAGIQGVTNTGNAQSALNVNDFNGEDFFFDDDDDFGFFFFEDFGDGDLEFEDVGAEIEVSPESSFSSDQSINQSATASD
jgi:opacity protein-like surface antigen